MVWASSSGSKLQGSEAPFKQRQAEPPGRGARRGALAVPLPPDRQASTGACPERVNDAAASAVGTNAGGVVLVTAQGLIRAHASSDQVQRFAWGGWGKLRSPAATGGVGPLIG